jgi:sugar phosphate isomerase/epimerase
MKLGGTTIPLAGWVIDPQQPVQSRTERQAAIRTLVERYGLAAVELTLDLGILYPQVFDADFYAGVAKLQQELAFACTAHLPFLWLDPSAPNEPVRQASLACLQRALRLVRPVEVEAYVLHLWGATTIQIAGLLEHPAQRQAILGILLTQAARSLDRLCEDIAPHKLCVENLEAPAFDLVWPVLEQRGVSVCLDVGHLAWQGGHEQELLARHSRQIRVIHLHDARVMHTNDHRQVRDHLPLGEGQIDHRAFLQRVQGMGYQGVVVLEVNNQADLEACLVQVQAFL